MRTVRLMEHPIERVVCRPKMRVAGRKIDESCGAERFVSSCCALVANAWDGAGSCDDQGKLRQVCSSSSGDGVAGFAVIEACKSCTVSLDPELDVFVGVATAIGRLSLL